MDAGDEYSAAAGLGLGCGSVRGSGALESSCSRALVSVSTGSVKIPTKRQVSVLDDEPKM